jgi:1-acyl-sn-glycerol-3-phosphate acyltransferase
MSVAPTEEFDRTARPGGGADTAYPTLLLEVLEGFARESQIPIPPAGLDLETRLEADLGLDSLARSELLARVEQRFGRALPDEAILAATARDLLALLAQAPAPGGPAPEPASPLAVDSGTGHPEAAATLLEALDWHLERHPERVHILYYDAQDQPQPITYEGLQHGAAEVAGRLRQGGLQPDSTVALMLPTCPEYFYSFFGVLMAGGIPVPIYPPARPQQIEDHLRRHARILDNARAGFLITAPEATTVGRLMRIHVPSLRQVLTLGKPQGEPLADCRPSLASKDIAFLQYTSGSTGDPKGVTLSHADLLANIRAMGTAAKVRPNDVFVSWLPLYHDMGLIGAWLGSLYYGLPLISMTPLAFLARPARWLQAIHRHRGTLSAAPNFAFELCLTRVAEGTLDELDLGSWRWAFNGAEPVSPVTLRRFAERFARCGLRQETLAPVYGLAEAGVGLAFPPAGRGYRIDCIDRTRLAEGSYALRVPCSDPGALEIVGCGRPLPGYRLRVVDAEGRALPERHEGHVQFQGPSATRGYFRNPEATARLIRDGWHDTGDRGYFAGGEIHITGRVKDLIIRGGRNIYPYELEEAVGELKGIRQGCVVAFAAADLRASSERLVLVAETKMSDPGRRAALEQAVRERVSEIIGLPPDEVVLAPPRSVLKTSSGKLRRAATRDRYLAGRLADRVSSPVWQLVRLSGAGVLANLERWGARGGAMLYGAYAWALCGLLVPFVWLGVTTLPSPGARWAVARTAVRWLRRLSLVRLAITGAEHIPPRGQPFVLAANHQSYLDAFVLMEAVPRSLSFVAKRELSTNPLLRGALDRLQTLYVERFDVRRSLADSAGFGEALRSGRSLSFFPEGTFRNEPGLLPFRMGAFATAAAAGVAVLPVAIRGTRQLMPGGFVPRPGKIRVEIGKPIMPKSGDWAEAVRLRKTTRQFILEHSCEPDAFDQISTTTTIPSPPRGRGSG